MSKSIQFPGKPAKVTSILPELKEYMEMAEARDESITNFIEYLEGRAKESLQNTGLSSVDFVLSEESMHQLATIMPGPDGEGDGSYSFVGEDGDKIYNMIITIETDEEDEDLFMSTVSLFSLKKGEVAFFDYNDNTWKEEENLKVIYDILTKDDGRSALLYSLEDIENMDIRVIDPKYLLEILDNNKKIIDLYEKLHGLGDFQVWFKDEDDIPLVLLVPDDPLRSGCAVVYQDDAYQVCKYTERMAPYGQPDENGAVYYVPELNVISVFPEKSASKVASYLRFIWDHYSREDVVALPLSPSAYVETTDPEEYLGKIFTKGGPRKLTAVEKEQLAKLRRYYGTRMR